MYNGERRNFCGLYRMINEFRIKYLEFVQCVINRMNKCSFIIKAWGMTFISAFYGVVLSHDATSFRGNKLLFAIVILCLLWCSDSYYLYLEKGYRGLYDAVIGNKLSRDFDMSIPNDARGYKMFVRAMFAKVNSLFWIGLVAIIATLNLFW